MIIYANAKSKRKKSKTKKQIQEYNDWLKKIQADKSGFSSKTKMVKIAKKQSTTVPHERDTKQYPSITSDYYNTFKKQTNVYTGDKMIGIGTLHKSNAVPIFNIDDAKDQANMRR